MITALLFATARIALDPGISAIEPYPVEGHSPRRWEKPVSFGPWRTGPVDEPGTFGFAAQALHLGGGYAKTPYRFRVEGESGSIDAECFAHDAKAWYRGIQADLRQAKGKPVLACAFRGADGVVTTFELKGKGTGKYVGTVAGAEPIEVRSEHRVEGSRLPLGEPAGYLLSRGGTPIGAVETLNRGRVWLADGSPLEAATVTALLLFVPPDAGEMEIER